MKIKTTKEIAEVHNKHNSKDTELFMEWVAVDDMIEKLKKRGITKYHILGELLRTHNKGKK